MVPDGCRAVVTRFGKLEEVVEAGRKLLFDPWKQVSYIVNTTRDYPYNAPIREAPTASRVNASVDLFLQFRIEDPAEFIFVARMLEKQETEAQRVRLEIETRGRAALTEVENEATALRHLGQAHRDNRAVVRYELARRRVEVGERLMQRAPRPSSSAAKEASNQRSPPSSSPGSSRN
jgi:SPFH domain / Band 7 family